MTDFSHLIMKVGTCARINYVMRQVIARFFFYVPGARHLLRLLNILVTKFNNIDRAYRETKKFIATRDCQQSDVNAQSFNSGFGYNGDVQELICADHYRSELLNKKWPDLSTESVDLYREILALASSYITEHHISEVLNFGVSYAHIDSELAKAHPNTNFTGVDRSVLTKFYNEQLFNQPNLRFEASDIMEFLKKHTHPGAMMMHTRTMTCLPAEFAEPFYSKCAESGCEHILLAEQCGISWETGEPYIFSEQPQKSVVFRNFMYIHNYPAILKKAGYKVIHSRLLETQHPDPNYRLLIILASKH